MRVVGAGLSLLQLLTGARSEAGMHNCSSTSRTFQMRTFSYRSQKHTLTGIGSYTQLHLKISHLGDEEFIRICLETYLTEAHSDQSIALHYMHNCISG